MEALGYFLVIVIVAFLVWSLFGWILMLSLGGLGLKAGFWPCFGLSAFLGGVTGSSNVKANKT